MCRALGTLQTQSWARSVRILEQPPASHRLEPEALTGLVIPEAALRQAVVCMKYLNTKK